MVRPKPLNDLAARLALHTARSAAPPLRLTCYGKTDCPLCDKAKGPVARVVRASGGRVTAAWIDILDDEALVARWGQRIPVICAGETVLAEGKVSEIWLRRALASYLRHGARDA